MPILAVILLLFIGIPLIEIYVLIEVGSAIGALTTVFAVVFTAVLGVALIRIQGFSTLQKAQAVMNQGGVPALEMFEGVMLLLAAICLLIPGFFTDSIGFLLLVPPLRHYFAGRLIGNAAFKSRFRGSQGMYIEGEYEDVTSERPVLRNGFQQQNNSSAKEKNNNIIDGEIDSDDK